MTDQSIIPWPSEQMSRALATALLESLFKKMAVFMATHPALVGATEQDIIDTLQDVCDKLMERHNDHNDFQSES